MSKIDEVFHKLANRNQTALIPFLVGGDPDLDTSAALIWKLAELGADLIEIGVPYSDPIADGPVIQKAAQRALHRGINLAEIFKIISMFGKIPTPIIIMSYFNPIFSYGLRSFAYDCAHLGVAGVIIPDLPPEEAEPWIREARSAAIDTIFLTSPTSSSERIKKIANLSQGFIYHVSLTGVTGPREQLPKNIYPALQIIKKESFKPVAVGFGISSPQQAQEISTMAEGVIIGSALIKIIEKEKNKKTLLSQIESFFQPFVTILHSAF